MSLELFETISSRGKSTVIPVLVNSSDNCFSYRTSVDGVGDCILFDGDVTYDEVSGEGAVMTADGFLPVCTGEVLEIRAPMHQLFGRVSARASFTPKELSASPAEVYALDPEHDLWQFYKGLGRFARYQVTAEHYGGHSDSTPDLYVHCPSQIDWSRVKGEWGVTTALFDIDGTLVPVMADDYGMAPPIRRMLESLIEDPDVQPVLATNREDEPTLEFCGLSLQMFTANPKSCDNWKPAKGYFEHVLETLGVASESVVIVGDTPGHDILGGNEVGIRTILVDRLDPTGYLDVRN